MMQKEDRTAKLPEKQRPMRFSVRCPKCVEAVHLDWKVCPKCLLEIVGPHIKFDSLRQNIRQDVEKFFVADSLFEGNRFVAAAVQDCLFDWEWAAGLEWAEGQWFLGKCHAEQFLPQSSESQAVEFYRLAAEQGFPPAENALGYCFLKGRGGVSKNPAQAFRLVQSAADHGYLHAKYNLSSLYRCGHGVAKAKALQIHFEVAEEGFAPAQDALGTLYRLGSDGVPLSPTLAMQWYVKAAMQGYGQALFDVGALYYYGEGVPKNRKEARKWYLEAARRGNSGAKRVLEVEDKKLFPWGF